MGERLNFFRLEGKQVPVYFGSKRLFLCYILLLPFFPLKSFGNFGASPFSSCCN